MNADESMARLELREVVQLDRVDDVVKMRSPSESKAIPMDSTYSRSRFVVRAP